MTATQQNNTKKITTENDELQTFSIIKLVREELQKFLQEFQIVKYEEINALIEKCIKERMTAVAKSESLSSIETISVNSNSKDVALEVETKKNTLIVKNMDILEKRIANLEERISSILIAIPKMNKLNVQKVKIDTKTIKDCTAIQKKKQEGSEKERQKQKQSNCGKKYEMPLPVLSLLHKVSDEKQVMKSSDEKSIEKHVYNPYNDLYYEQRQYEINLLNFKKSDATLELNKRPVHDHFSPPPQPKKIDFKNEKIGKKQVAIFVTPGPFDNAK